MMKSLVFADTDIGKLDLIIISVNESSCSLILLLGYNFHKKSLQNIGHRKADTEAGFLGVVINHTLTVAGKALDVSLEIFVITKGKAPGRLNRSLVETRLQVIARHNSEGITMPLIGGMELAMSHIICDVGIVVVFVILRNPVPRLNAKYEIALFKNKSGKDAVPASGYGFVPAV